jgi:hypothetical protein
MNIAGVKNHAGHGSSAQKSIWHCLSMLSPFEAAGADGNVFNKADVIDGEKEFYQFMKDLYRDMYGDPAKYAIPTEAYDEYIKTVKKNVVKAHQTDAKESKLRNEFQQAIQFYHDYFYASALVSDRIRKKDFSLVIAKSKYDETLRSLDRPHICKENGQRMKALADRGVTVNELSGTCYMSCSTAPKMFLGLQVLCSAPEGKYKYTNYLRLDYKGFCGDMPGIEDVKSTMKKEHAASVDLFLKLFGGVKMKYRVKPLRSITSGHGWKVEHTLNGKSVFGFFAEPDHLAFYIYFNDAKNITETSRKLESDSELFDWFCGRFPEKLCKCPSNRAVTFGKIKRRICGLSNRAEIINPGAGDIQKCIAITKIFRNGLL